MTTSTESKTTVAVKTDLLPPPEYKVIFLNDDVTTMEFVMEILVTVFHYEVDAAKDTTIRIHEQGECVVAVLPYELAEQKSAETIALAKSNSFPLNIKLEPVS